MTSRLTNGLSSALLAAFLLFNAGMPVYLYLCPMMSDENPVCDMSPAQADGLSLTSITPDCCARVLVAERITTPFVKSDIKQPDVERIQAEAPQASLPTFVGIPVVHADPTVPRSDPSAPLFLLHRSLLI